MKLTLPTAAIVLSGSILIAAIIIGYSLITSSHPPQRYVTTSKGFVLDTETGQLYLCGKPFPAHQ